MNRREFNTSLGALGVAAAVPVSVAAKVALPEVSPMLYQWGAALARAQNRASPQILARQLGLSAEQGVVLYSRLMQRGTIGAANAAGLSRAIDPLFAGGRSIPVAAPADIAQTAKRLQLHARQLWEHLDTDTPEAASEDQELID